MSVERRSILKSTAAAIAVAIPGAIAGCVPLAMAVAASADPLLSLIFEYRKESEAFNAWAMSDAGLVATATEHEERAARYERLQVILWKRPPMPTSSEGAALAQEEFARYYDDYELRGDDPLFQVVIAYLRGGLLS